MYVVSSISVQTSEDYFHRCNYRVINIFLFSITKIDSLLIIINSTTMCVFLYV